MGAIGVEQRVVLALLSATLLIYLIMLGFVFGLAPAARPALMVLGGIGIAVVALGGVFVRARAGARPRFMVLPLALLGWAVAFALLPRP
jgi:hypothetical protein